MSKDEYLAVIAIDFGTSFSGYAFSMRSDKNDIKMNKSWGAEVGFQAYKTPTAVLLRLDGSLHSFGFEAQNAYADLDTDEIKEGYELFERFKMELYAHKVSLILLIIIKPSQHWKAELNKIVQGRWSSCLKENSL